VGGGGNSACAEAVFRSYGNHWSVVKNDLLQVALA